jgi:hypothetical protein
VPSINHYLGRDEALKKEFHMNFSAAVSTFDRFYDAKEYCIEGDDPTTTLISCGAVLFGSVLASSRCAGVLSELTGLPAAFTTVVILIAEHCDLFFSVSYADLIISVRRDPENFDAVEKAIDQLMCDFWQGMEKHWANRLTMVRAGYLVGGSRQEWLHDEEEYGTLDYDDPLVVN